MIVYRFFNETWGLAALRERRFKLSLVNELNDPFEFMAIDVGDERVRRSFARVKASQARSTGLLCFSTYWSNPVLWSHYADCHRGICLGFDVAKEFVRPVEYAKERIVPEQGWLGAPEGDRIATMLRIIMTKFDHWAYECEVRLFARLEEKDSHTGHYFKPFDPDLTLTHVIVGHRCGATREKVVEALGHPGSVELIKARAAFTKFCIVPDQRGLRPGAPLPMRAA